jgi:hypothetical protein
LVRFSTDAASLWANEELLAQHDYDLGAFLDVQEDTMLAFGSKFRPVSQLDRILGQHPNSPFFCNVLGSGMDYYFESDLTEDKRLAKLNANLNRGNHQSPSQDEAKVEKLLGKEVQHGFSLPIPKDATHKLRCNQPAWQSTLDYKPMGPVL